MEGVERPVDGRRAAGTCTVGLRPTTVPAVVVVVAAAAALGVASRLTLTTEKAGLAGSTLKAALSTSPVGEHILHVQLSVLLSSSVHSHSK